MPAIRRFRISEANIRPNLCHQYRMFFVTDIDTAFVQQILYVAKRQRVPDVEHDRQADDIRTGLEGLELLALGWSAPTEVVHQLG